MGIKKERKIEDFEFIEKNPQNVVRLNSPLGGNFADYVLEKKYLPLVEEKYDSHPALLGITKNVFSGHLENFNLYKAVLMNEVVESQYKSNWDFRLRGINLGDLGELRNNKAFSFNEHAYFLGVVLRGVGEPKSNNSKAMVSQLEELSGHKANLIEERERSHIGKVHSLLKTPVYFSLSDLEVDVNPVYSKGIGVKIKNVGEEYPEFGKSSSSNISSFEGGRINLGPSKSPIMFTKSKSGLSRILLKGYSVLDSSVGAFTNNVPNSYFVLVKNRNL
jgi:hypothetical protein